MTDNLIYHIDSIYPLWEKMENDRDFFDTYIMITIDSCVSSFKEQDCYYAYWESLKKYGKD